MLTPKILIIVFILILICFGIVVWANTTEISLTQKIKGKQINSFSQCVAAGYPIQGSYPRRCSVPNGSSFVENLDSNLPEASPSSICIDKCGDGICQQVVCEGSDCPCAETAASCPQDCK